MPAAAQPVKREVVADNLPNEAQLHGSTVVVTGSGELVVAWFEGEHEGAADSRIRLARREFRGETRGNSRGVWGGAARGASRGGWTAATDPVGADAAPTPHWNPVLARGRADGVLSLFFKSGPSIATWRTFVVQSHDDGRTWSAATELVPGDESGGRGPVRQAPVSWGRYLLAPGSIEDWSAPPRWDAFVDIGDGDGRWQQVRIPIDRRQLRGAGVIQPCLWRNAAGGVTMLCRSTEGVAYRSATEDPRDWPPLTPVPLPNNNSGLAAIALAGGRIACVHNPSGTAWGPRCPLVISTSDDDGLSWAERVVVEDGTPFAGSPTVSWAPGHHDGSPDSAGATGIVTSGRGEYSYPSVTSDGQNLLISYSWQRQAIVLATMPLDQLATEGNGQP